MATMTPTTTTTPTQTQKCGVVVRVECAQSGELKNLSVMAVDTSTTTTTTTTTTPPRTPGCWVVVRVRTPRHQSEELENLSVMAVDTEEEAFLTLLHVAHTWPVYEPEVLLLLREHSGFALPDGSGSVCAWNLHVATFTRDAMDGLPTLPTSK
jgi:hypothetical protein